jgi:hypothetical protein
MIILAPFYKDITASQESIEVQEMSKVFDYRHNLTRFKNTFMIENSHHKFEICTDSKTKLKFDHVFRTDLTDLNLMESFCVSNLEFVKHREEKLVLCGADHLVNGKLETLFEDDFDIGLAVAGKPTRINNTIVLVNNRNRSGVIKFFENRLNVFYNLTKDEKIWYGDQLSYQRILENAGIFNPDKGSPSGLFNVGELKIKLFPYGGNYVKGFKKSLMPVNQNPIIVDFKGPSRKKRVEEIYNSILK